MWTEDGLFATIARIAYVVDRDKNGRFQLIQRYGQPSYNAQHFVIRAVQGHSRAMQDLIDGDTAHKLVYDEVDISHATYSYILP